MKQGTCRIFLVPKFDERGQPLRFRDQRSFAIEMDKFSVTRKCIVSIFVVVDNSNIQFGRISFFRSKSGQK